jgi:molybdate transport system ATP-binding protein
VLDAHLGKQRGGFVLDVTVRAEPGDTTVVVGESGAGKTSVLRLLAGLDRLEAGHVTLDGVRYAEAAGGLHVPAWQRNIGYVAQDYALFPHLSVRENVAFGLRAGGTATGGIRAAVAAALDLVGIPELAARLPHQLSGGQQQRAALARALVLEPRLLLLDEPLSALDIQTRRSVRVELRALLERLPCVTIYVTHSPIEALVLGDQVVVLDAGRVTQAGSRDDLLRRPRSPFVAELIGTNLFIGQPTELATAPTASIRTPEGAVAIGPAGGPDTVYLTVSPREIMLSRSLPEGSPQNVFAGSILELIPEAPGGERVRVVLDTRPALVAEVTREAVAALALKEGVRVYAAFKATGVHRYA